MKRRESISPSFEGRIGSRLSKLLLTLPYRIRGNNESRRPQTHRHPPRNLRRPNQIQTPLPPRANRPYLLPNPRCNQYVPPYIPLHLCLPPLTPPPAAQKYVLCTYNVPRTTLPTVIKITPGKRAPTVTQLMGEGEENWAAVSVMVEKSKIAGVMDELEVAGATDILVVGLTNSRSS